MIKQDDIVTGDDPIFEIYGGGVVKRVLLGTAVVDFYGRDDKLAESRKFSTHSLRILEVEDEDEGDGIFITEKEYNKVAQEVFDDYFTDAYGMVPDSQVRDVMIEHIATYSRILRTHLFAKKEEL